MDSHRERILDQFSRQAVPFATAPTIRNEDALNRIVQMAESGRDDTVLDVACGPGLLVCAFARKARQHRRAVAQRELTAEILRHVFSPALLFGKRMIVTAVREPAAANAAVR